MKLKTSKIEVKHLAKAWAAITLAFTILFSGKITSVNSALIIFLISGLTVGVAFILHELAHKAVAQYYGLFAEFRSDGKMLLIAIATSFFGIILAAPGAVMISGHAGVNKAGKVAMAGPLTNIILAIGFILLSLIIGSSMLTDFGKMINAWLALFNMIPFSIFDGAKILRWNKKIYTAMLISAIVLLVL
ncbi:MAG: hypothetical protein V1914_02945 [archaeon]